MMNQHEIEQLANRIHDCDIQTRWKIIEATMRMSLIQMHADRQVVVGKAEGSDTPIWMMLATEELGLIERIQKAMDEHDKPEDRQFIEQTAAIESEQPRRIIIDPRHLSDAETEQVQKMAMAIGRFVGTYCVNETGPPGEMMHLVSLVPFALAMALQADEQGRKNIGLASEGIDA